jgi:hypothetical protein
MQQSLLALSLLVPALASAACPVATTTEELADTLVRAERAYKNVDIEGFQMAFQEANLVLLCVDRVVDERVAAQFHRMRGVDQFIRRDLDASVRSFAASRHVAPDQSLELAGPSHPLQEAFQNVDLGTGAFQEVPPAQGALAFDGRKTDLQPLDWPTIFQVVDEEGVVVGTRLLTGGAVASGYPLRPSISVVEPVMDPDPGPAPVFVAPEPKVAQNGGLWVAPATVTVGAVGAGVFTGITWSKANDHYRQYLATEDDFDAHDIWTDQVRPTRTWSAAGLGVGVALTAASAVLWSSAALRVEARGNGLALHGGF